MTNVDWTDTYLHFSFRPKQNEKDYVLIRKGNHPYSNVGYSTGENVITLNEESLDYGEILHLFFHALGIDHNSHPEELIESQ